MIQKAVISEIIDSYQLKVRIPKYDKLASSVDGVSSEDLSTGIICAYPGMQVAYTAGDVVLVAFENNEISKPVVLGLLYREGTNDASVSKISRVEETLTSITEALDRINLSGLYTHIKYSNDNGATFTSLYDYTDVNDESSSYYSASDIKINPLSSIVTWSISNNEGIDVTSQFQIETTVHVKKGIADGVSYTSTEPVFNIPINIRNLGSLYISFKVLKSKDVNDYHFSLATDRDAIGTTYGDYIGILIDENPIASTSVTDYTWGSLVSRALSAIDVVKEEILRRVRLNERALYGKTDEETISDGTGLLNAISVGSNSITLGQNKSQVYFDTDRKTYVDNNEHSVYTPKVTMADFEWRAESGHLRLYVKRG